MYFSVSGRSKGVSVVKIEMRWRNWASSGLASFSASCGCPEKMICSSLSLAVSKFDSSRIVSNTSVLRVCASSITMITGRPLRNSLINSWLILSWALARSGTVRCCRVPKAGSKGNRSSCLVTERGRQSVPSLEPLKYVRENRGFPHSRWGDQSLETDAALYSDNQRGLRLLCVGLSYRYFGFGVTQTGFRVNRNAQTDAI